MFQSCTDSTTTSNSDETELTFTDFLNFPKSPFISLEFNSTLSKNITQIESNGFISTTENVYSRHSDSTTLILSEPDNLTEFKVYLKSTFYLQKNKALFDFFTEKSAEYMGTSQFAEMTFIGEDNTFTLTYFSTNTYIRLYYNLQSVHN